MPLNKMMFCMIIIMTAGKDGKQATANGIGATEQPTGTNWNHNWFVCWSYSDMAPEEFFTTCSKLLSQFLEASSLRADSSTQSSASPSHFRQPLCCSAKMLHLVVITSRSPRTILAGPSMSLTHNLFFFPTSRPTGQRRLWWWHWTREKSGAAVLTYCLPA